MLAYVSLRMLFTGLHGPTVSNVILEVQLETYTIESRSISQDPYRQCINTSLTITIRKH